MSVLHPFHLAIPVRNIHESRTFYDGLIGFAEGRYTVEWIDWNC